MRRLGQAAPLLIVLGAAFALRIWGWRYCLPYGFGHVDEEVIIRDAMQMGAAKSLKPAFFDYPALYTYLSLVAIGIKFAVLRLVHVYSSPNDLALEYALRPGYIHLAGRMVSIIAGTLSVGLTYMLGRKVANGAVGLSAAILLAFSVEHANQSHWALPDVTMALLFTGALYLSYRLVETGSIRSYIAAGLVAGLALSSKYNAGSIVPIMALAHILRVRSERPKSVAGYMDRRLIAGALCVAAGFLIATPYWILDSEHYLNAMRWNQSHMKEGHLGFQGLRWLWFPVELVKTEKIAGVLMILGVVRSIWARRREDTLLMAAILLTFLVTGSSLKTSLYFFLPIYPAMCVLGMKALADIPRLRRQMVLLPAAAALIAVPQLVDIIRLDHSQTLADTRLTARAWIEKHILSGATVVMEEPRAYSVPLIADNFVQHWGQLCPAIRTELADDLRGIPYYRIIGTKTPERSKSGTRASDYAAWSRERKCLSPDDLRKQGAQYLILSSYNYERFYLTKPPPVGSPLRDVFFWEKSHYDKLMSSPELKLIKRISPEKNQLGPTLRIYRVMSDK